jgi:hypothetical protein
VAKARHERRAQQADLEEPIAPVITLMRLNFDVQLREEYIPILGAKMAGPDGMTDVQKIRDMAETVLEQIAQGGIVLDPDEVQRITDSTGVPFASGDDLVPFLSERSAMVDGKHRVTVLIDPANYPAYEELAKVQERTVDELMQEVVDMVQENEWVYELHPRPRHILMTEADAKLLEELAGGKFSTGADLAQLLIARLTQNVEDQSGVSLFDETTVEQEA